MEQKNTSESLMNDITSILSLFSAAVGSQIGLSASSTIDFFLVCVWMLVQNGGLKINPHSSVCVCGGESRIFTFTADVSAIRLY